MTGEFRPVGRYFPGGGTLFTESFLEGRAEGYSDSVVRVLRARDIDVPTEALQRIQSCADPDTLKHWLALAATTATRVEDLFDSGPWWSRRTDE
ncbi:hypothetical protein AB0C52_05610 [Streptomyces sp. NPDC048717]|uniref:hypothetical protein n=1 Tax=Streptomyces sp. NPDC048717 TaxID=3154928 RepID=UPI003424DF00